MRKLVHQLALPALAFSVVVVTGCSNESSAPVLSTSPTNQTMASTVSETTKPPSPGVTSPTSTSTSSEPMDSESAAATPQPSPTWDQASTATAQTAAIGTMEAFARRDLTPDEWSRNLSGHMTESGAKTFAGTDPQNIPVRQVATRKGSATVGDRESGYLARVLVKTDVGRYEVLLTRDGQNAPWRANDITPTKPTRP